jgi:hypothetical protein
MPAGPDCEFVGLAADPGMPLVTADRARLKALPSQLSAAGNRQVRLDLPRQRSVHRRRLGTGQENRQAGAQQSERKLIAPLSPKNPFGG